MTERGRVGLALAVIVLAATALRFWGLGYGLPNLMARPDEELTTGKALELSLGHIRDPGVSPYPSLVYYLDAFALSSWRRAGVFLGAYGDTEGFLVDLAVRHPGLHFTICRVVGALLGAATVPAVFLAGFHGYRRRSVGLLASLLVGVNFLHARDSHFATVDVPMTFFVTVAMAFALRGAGTLSRRDILTSAFFGGLAASAKYNAVVVALCPAVAAAHNLLGRTAEARRKALVTLVLVGVVTAVTFALTSPYCVLRWRDVSHGLARTKALLFGNPGPPAWQVHLSTTLPGAFGWPGFVLALAGFVRAVWKRRPADLVVLAFVVPCFISMAGITWVLPRYPIPLVPPLALLAAEAALSPAAKWRAPWLAAAGLAAALPPLVKIVSYDRLATQADTRVLAAEWVAANVSPRTRIAVCRGYGAPAVNADHRRPPAFKPAEVPCTVDAIRGTGASYVIVHDHPQVRFFHPSDAVLRWLGAEARPVAVFDPFRKGAEDAFFFGSDAFYIPYSGFGAVERGGPIVTIWRLVNVGS